MDEPEGDSPMVTGGEREVLVFAFATAVVGGLDTASVVASKKGGGVLAVLVPAESPHAPIPITAIAAHASSRIVLPLLPTGRPTRTHCQIPAEQIRQCCAEVVRGCRSCECCGNQLP